MHKNWKVICGITDTHLMWAMALLDLESAIGRRIVAQLPEYFTEEEQQGPIPLSAIRLLAERDAMEQGANPPYDCLTCFNKYWGDKFDIPIMSFKTDPDSVFEDLPLLPPEIQNQIDQLGRRPEVGEIFEWEGKKLVLMENNDSERGSCFNMDFAPAELIAVEK
jgi:hypothetical protein